MVALVTAVAVLAAALGVGGALLLSGRSHHDDQAAHVVTKSDTTTTTTTAPRSTTTTEAPATTSAPSAGDAAAVFAQVKSGVVRVRASVCGGSGEGTGFLIGGDRVATAAHVVAGAVAVSVETPSGTYAATVESIDEAADLASLRLSTPDPGHVFAFATADPAPGTSAVAIGYPLDGQLSVTEGTVSGVDRTVQTDTGTRSGLLQTDAAVNPGNSGGPLVTMSGEVVGVVSGSFPDYENLSFAVESSTAGPWFAAPPGSAGTGAPLPVSCQPLGPEVTSEVPVPASTGVPSGVGAMFEAYFGGINSGDYQTAWQQLSARRRGDGSGYDHFAAGLRTSYDYGFVVHSATYADGQAHVWLDFVSIQDPSLGPGGNQSCTQWSIDYVLLEQPDGSFVIDGVGGHAGASPSQACQ
jgi:S1-C subfamily serine protease